MNISREKSGDLEQIIKIELSEVDYKERVQKQLKNYRQKANIPGFRKGMAPKSLIARKYKAANVGEEIENLLGESLYKYIEDEKLEILGGPLSNESKTGEIDFAKDKDFVFYYDIAEAPKMNIDWSKIDEKLCQIKITAKEVDAQVEELAKRHGKFETPETIGENDFVYGRLNELDKEGKAKEDGVKSFTSFELTTIKSDEIRQSFLGKKVNETVVFNAAKAFSAADIERYFHLEADVAKKFKSDVEMTISGCSHITPHEVNEELFALAFPNETFKDLAAFRKRLQKEMEKNNDEQCQYLYVTHVRKALMDQFEAPLPEAFLKRWILTRGAKDVTPENIDNEWNDKYVPSIKWEILDGELNKIKSLNPTHNDIVDYVKGLISANAATIEGESDKEKEERLEKMSQSIVADSNNTRQIVDRLYVNNTFELFKEQLKPEVEKVSLKEFSARANQ